MNPNECILRNGIAVLIFVMTAVLFLPATLLAKGAVIGYWWGNNTVTNVQLEKLTHIMAVDLYINPTTYNVAANPELDSTYSGNWENAKLVPLVDSAHAKGVKVSIVIGGDDFNIATNNTNRATLVSSIVSYVNRYDLDGVDIDWEYPNNTTTDYTEWYQYVALLQELKAALPSKRISVAIFRYAPDWWFDYPFVNTIPVQIWNTVDAIHIMTYDCKDNHNGWQGYHSDASSSTAAIDAWAEWGTSGGRNLDMEKLHVGCAFYGYNKDANSEFIFHDPTGRVAKIPYDNQGNLLRNAKTKGGSIQFNVSSLPNGIYYLHICDGVSPKPEIRQIAVEH